MDEIKSVRVEHAPTKEAPPICQDLTALGSIVESSVLKNVATVKEQLQEKLDEIERTFGVFKEQQSMHVRQEYGKTKKNL